MIAQIIFGVFCVLHGLVHILYFGQSSRYFELKQGMLWPDGAWVFSKWLGATSVRMLASLLLVVAAIGFVSGGVGLILNQTWWPSVVAGVAIFSTIIYLLFWDGGFQNLDGEGGVGILINMAILTIVIVSH